MCSSDLAFTQPDYFSSKTFIKYFNPNSRPSPTADDLSVIGSFNMDMRSAYLDTEMMLVIRSKDINKQLEEGMMEYEKVSRQILEGGTYNDPYHVEPIELTKKRQRKIFLVQHLLGWARYLF